MREVLEFRIILALVEHEKGRAGDGVLLLREPLAAEGLGRAHAAGLAELAGELARRERFAVDAACRALTHSREFTTAVRTRLAHWSRTGTRKT